MMSGACAAAGFAPTAALTLLSRAYCGLCEVMQQQLVPIATAAGANLRVVDVDADAALAHAWGDLVPVLFLGEPAAANELCHYHLDARRVLDALSCAHPHPAQAAAESLRIR